MHASVQTGAMARQGAFPDDDPGEVVDVLERRVLRSGIGRLLRRINGVVIGPFPDAAAARNSTRGEVGNPQVTISSPGLFAKKSTAFVVPPDGMTRDWARSRVVAAKLNAPEPRKSAGQYVYDFPLDTSATQLVEFALGVLRALGAQPTNGRWAYCTTEPEGA